MKRRTWIIGGLAGLAALGSWGAWAHFKPEPTGRYRTATVEQGDVVQTVRATGVLKPVKRVAVGTQVNGPILKLYVDFNDRVKQGDLVAQIDPTVYEARLAQDQANLAQSRAGVEQAQARLTQAERELTRATPLAQGQMLSQTDLEAATAARDIAAAQLRMAQAAVSQAEAALRLSQANLGYTTIRSPVDGVIIARNVDEGQTVVSSLSAQQLFEIATDLGRMQVEANLPEADIGRIHPAQPVSFTVDAYDQTFTGVVAQVRMNAASVQNVVTYPVIILADNPDGKLFPGMTATLTFEVARRSGVLKIPNGALRFRPEEKNGTKKKQLAMGTEKSGRDHRRGPRVWIQSGPGQPPAPVPVQTGITDGSFTEILTGSTLNAGQEIIVGALSADTKSSATVNPFTPRMPGGSRHPPR